MPKLGDKLDAYRAFLREEKPLTPQQLQMLEKYYFAWTNLCQGYSRQQVLKQINGKYGNSLPQCYAIIRDSMALLGNALEANREGKLAMQVDRFKQLAKKAEKNGDFKAAVRAEVEAAKLENLYDHNQTLIDPKKFLRPTAIVFTSDPDILKQQRLENTQDIEHEEIE